LFLSRIETFTRVSCPPDMSTIGFFPSTASNKFFVNISFNSLIIDITDL